MKIPLLLILALVILNSCLTQTKKDKVNNYNNGILTWNGTQIDQDTSKWEYPCTLDSTMLMLFHSLNDSIIDQIIAIPDSSLAEINLSFGMWLRNSYGLWSQTCLVEYFWSNGIFHPDDISASIIIAFKKYLENEPFSLVEMQLMFESFWKNQYNIKFDTSNLQYGSYPSLWDYGSTYYNYDKTSKGK